MDLSIDFECLDGEGDRRLIWRAADISVLKEGFVGVLGHGGVHEGFCPGF